MATSHPTNSDEQFWTDLGMKYEAAYGQDVVLKQVVNKFLDKLPRSANVLDCGPGTGKPVAKAIADSGRHVHGIDMSGGMVELSRKAVPSGTFEEANMLLYEPTVSYDGVVASLSIFELSREETGIMALKWFRWLRPGGVLLVNAMSAEDCAQARPEHYDADGECANGVEWVFMGNRFLITLFTKAGWKALLEEAGFEIVHTEQDLYCAAAADCEPEPRYYIIAKKPSSAND